MAAPRPRGTNHEARAVLLLSVFLPATGLCQVKPGKPGGTSGISGGKKKESSGIFRPISDTLERMETESSIRASPNTGRASMRGQMATSKEGRCGLRRIGARAPEPRAGDQPSSPSEIQQVREDRFRKYTGCMTTFSCKTW